MFVEDLFSPFVVVPTFAQDRLECTSALDWTEAKLRGLGLAAAIKQGAFQSFAHGLPQPYFVAVPEVIKQPEAGLERLD